MADPVWMPDGLFHSLSSHHITGHIRTLLHCIRVQMCNCETMSLSASDQSSGFKSTTQVNNTTKETTLHQYYLQDAFLSHPPL